MFGGVYFWAAAVLAAGSAAVACWIRPPLARDGWLRLLDLSLLALLIGILIQLLPLPASVVSLLSPHRLSYLREASLGGAVPSFVPLTLDRHATVHAFLATFCGVATFW